MAENRIYGQCAFEINLIVILFNRVRRLELI